MNEIPNKAVYVELNRAKNLVRRSGWRSWLASCAVADFEHEGRTWVVFDRDAPCWAERRRFRYAPTRGPIPPPGDFVFHLTAAAREIAARVGWNIFESCASCSVRRKILNAATWRGLPRMILSSRFRELLWRALPPDADELGAGGCASCGGDPRSPGGSTESPSPGS